MSKHKRIKKVRLSCHAKQRYQERTSLSLKEYESSARYAYNKGFSHSQLSDRDKEVPGVSRILMTRKSHIIKKYYLGRIYIFDSRTKRLITVYEVEEEELKLELDKIYKRKKISQAISKGDKVVKL